MKHIIPKDLWQYQPRTATIMKHIIPKDLFYDNTNWERQHSWSTLFPRIYFMTIPTGKGNTREVHSSQGFILWQYQLGKATLVKHIIPKDLFYDNTNWERQQSRST